MPGIETLMAQMRPQGSDLEPRVSYLETRLDRVDRAVYGDLPNHTPSLAARLDRIEARIETMTRHALYWRLGQTGLLLLIAGMLMGVLIR